MSAATIAGWLAILIVGLVVRRLHAAATQRQVEASRAIEMRVRP